MNFNQVKPCAECPFRKDAVRGWLGEDRDPQELVDKVLGRVDIGGGVFIGCEPMNFDCHVSTAKVCEDLNIHGTVPPEHEHLVSHCVGALLLLKATCKLPHDRVKAAMMNKVSSNVPMITTRDEFIAHHTITKKKKK